MDALSKKVEVPQRALSMNFTCSPEQCYTLERNVVMDGNSVNSTEVLP